MAKKAVSYHVVKEDGSLVREYRVKDHDDAKAEANRYLEGREDQNLKVVAVKDDGSAGSDDEDEE